MSSDHNMTWPQNADQHLLEIIKTGLQPLSIEIDNNFIVTNYWGDPERFALTQLSRNKTAGSLPFLVGLESIDEPLLLKFIQISDQHIAHIHVQKRQDKLIATLFNVTDEHDYIQPIQQGSHEAQLKNFYDEILINKLELTQKELNKSKQQIEKTSQLKSDFLASVSHEFRTPITSIIGYTDILHNQFTQRDSVESIDVIKRNAYFLLNMVNNILDEARLESGDVDISQTEVRLKDTVSFIEKMFTTMAMQKHIDFFVNADKNVPEYIFADELRLQQVLINLIGNAVKFTDEGLVKVQVGYQAEELTFEITDTGPGISHEDQSQIFQPFQRLSSTQQGAGLGLSITQHILEMMGGNLELKSEVGQGSSFTVSLPSNSSELKIHADIESVFEQQNVLVVEDNRDMSELLKLLLEGMGLNIDVISDGALVDAFVANHKPDLIIMDVNLPNKSGLEITESLRASNFNKPIIAFSAAGLAATKEQALAAGCDDYVDKSNVNTKRFRKLLARYLGNVSEAKSEVTSQFELLKAKYQNSLQQKHLTIQSSWKSCQSNRFDNVSCKMLYTLTHNLAGSAGSYGFEEVSAAAKSVNQCIQKDFSVTVPEELEEAIQELLNILQKYT